MLALALTADLTGVTDLCPTDTDANPYWYTFKVQCTSCRETHANWVSVSRFVSGSDTSDPSILLSSAVSRSSCWSLWMICYEQIPHLPLHVDRLASTQYNDLHIHRPTQEQNEMSGSRGEANFVWKCKNCKRESTASIKAAPKMYTQSSPPKTVNIIEFDCRGLEFTQFKPDGEWEATGLESGTKFTSVDLSEGEWFDYDEKAGAEVSIKDLKWEIRRA